MQISGTQSPTPAAPRLDPVRAVQLWFRKRRLRKLEAATRSTQVPLDARWSAIPDNVKPAWFRHIGQEIPQWHADEIDWQLASLALLQFFEVGRQQIRTAQDPSSRACALPSRAADSVWHAWLAHDAAGLTRWQERHFGMPIPHHEAAELGAPLAEALARSFVAACRNEGLSPMGGELPLMFALDGELGLPGGWAYERLMGQVVYRDMDEQGRRSGPYRVQPRLAPAALVEQGLLPAGKLPALDRRKKADDGASYVSYGGADGLAGDACNDGAHSGHSAHTAHSSDGGHCSGDGGSSCGSSGSSCGSSCGSA